MPVIKNFTASASSQPGRPAILGDFSAQFGIGATGLKAIGAPFKAFPGIGCPFSSIGVWQSLHKPTPSTIYLPRAIFAEEAGGDPPRDATTSNIAIPNSIANFIISTSQRFF